MFVNYERLVSSLCDIVVGNDGAGSKIQLLFARNQICAINKKGAAAVMVGPPILQLPPFSPSCSTLSVVRLNHQDRPRSFAPSPPHMSAATSIYFLCLEARVGQINRKLNLFSDLMCAKGNCCSMFNEGIFRCIAP